MSKNLKLKGKDIIELVPIMGGCFATDRITVEGMKVGYMFREEPDNDIDSGWRFLAGDEDQEYIDNPENVMVYEVNTIANYDPAIVPYINMPVGTELARIEGSDIFEEVDAEGEEK